MDKYVNSSEVLEFALRIEENGERFYQYAIGLITEEKIKEQLVALSSWEEDHVEYLRDLIGSLSGNNDEFPLYFSPEENSSEYLRALADQHIFIRSESIDGVIQACRTVPEILSLALRFEKDSVQFYRSLESKIIDPAAKLAIANIAHEEESHVEHILRLIHSAG